MEDNIVYIVIGLIACICYMLLRFNGFEKEEANKMADTIGLYLIYFLLFVFGLITIIYS